MEHIKIITVAWNRYYWRAYDPRASEDPDEWTLVASGAKDTRLGAQVAAMDALREVIPEEERDW